MTTGLRWKLADADPQGALFAEEELVDRHVGIGEYRGLEFLHVNAQRVINEVPAASRMPFRYTINAYRGCSHSCVYCLGGETPVLMGDGRVKPLAGVRAGDEVYGTVRVGSYRRYARTPVLAHWSTVKAAYRVTLEDGTVLVASGDHRFLTERGWKFVTGEGSGPDCRPHLTTNNALMGIGRFATPPKKDADYRAGYLCGMIRGDSAWPGTPPEEWTKGFLAGLFDAEGSHSQGVFRISNCDTQILEQAVVGLRRFGFRVVVESARQPDGPLTVRLVGGLKDHMRFFHMTDPAITRKWDLEGFALKSNARLGVEAIEPLGIEIPMYDITTGTGDFIANGVVSHNCFARPTHEYLGLNIGSDFDSKIVVKVNAVERVRAELRSPKWHGDHIAMGTNTDPYQRCEGKYHLTRGIIHALTEAGNPFSILTKSTLILRDLDLLAAAAESTEVRCNLSIGTLDEKVWKLTEPGTPHPRRRVEAVRKLNDAGVPTGVLVAPLLPGMSDAPEQVREVVEACVAAGAVSVSPIALHLRKGVKDHFMSWLAGARPDLVAEYEKRYRRDYLPPSEQDAIGEIVRTAAVQARGTAVSPKRTRTRQPVAPAATVPADAPIPAEVGAEQLPLL